MTYKLNTVEAEYAKDPKINRDDIMELADLTQQLENMPKIPEYMLIQFYQVSNYDIEKTRKLVELCYSFKTDAQELFTGQDFDQNKYNWTFWDLIYCLILPETTADGKRILYVGLKDFSSAKFDFVVMIAMSMRIVLTAILEKGICSGYVMVFDVQGYGLGHLLSMHISILRKFLFFLQEASPIRVTAIHVIHLHSIFDKLMKLSSPFMKKELYEMIRTYPTMDDFFKVVRKESFPKDLEGTYSKTRDELSEETRNIVNEFEVEVTEELQRRKITVNCQRSFFQNWKFF